MELIYALIIGIIQGLTEFLPISSTAHMTLLAKLLQSKLIEDPHLWTASMATIQLGTLLSLLIYFRKEVIEIPSDFLKHIFAPSFTNSSRVNSNFRLGLLILFGSVPIFSLGYLFKDFIEGDFTKNNFVIATTLILVAILLFIAEKTGKFKKSLDEINVFDAIIIGFAQSLALIPGVSRSGATITAGLFLNIKRDEAARFSFLLCIPAIFVSGVYEFYTNFKYFSSEDIGFILVASIVSFFSGYLAIAFLLNFLKTKSTLPFIVYRIVLGSIIFALALC
ncbi:MAG: undecaprenyl-diphosphatase UppP [Ignavibacteria bacterium]|nr:undecaprenyl-diphosphatase UppP [Ignavibacteria bacterium]